MEDERKKRIFEEEAELLKRVEEELNRILDEKTDLTAFFESRVENENFEDQYASQTKSDKWTKTKEKGDIVSRMSSLLERPYCFHFKGRDPDGEKELFLCDSQLDGQLMIPGVGTIIPKGLPFGQELDEVIKEVKRSDYVSPISSVRLTQGLAFFCPELIRKVIIQNGALEYVEPYYPLSDKYEVTTEGLFNFDLQDKPKDPDILHKLQIELLELIHLEKNRSFVAQCPGGYEKSKVLLRRLLYLYTECAGGKIELRRFMVISPTKLKNDEQVPSNLIGYISNYSAFELYKHILGEHDIRFIKPYFNFVEQEDLLPQEYLETVYNEDFIRRIDKKIEEVLQKNASLGCELLECTLPDKVFGSMLKRMAIKLNDRIQALCQELLNSIGRNGKTSKFDQHRIEEMMKAEKVLKNSAREIYMEAVRKILHSEKKKHKIPTKDENNRDIMYKSDLMFYVRVYMRLYPRKVRKPMYRFLCVDEGQNLYRADYDILRKIYPEAVFNIFVNTPDQPSENIEKAWSRRTGVNTIITLNACTDEK